MDSDDYLKRRGWEECGGWWTDPQGKLTYATNIGVALDMQLERDALRLDAVEAELAAVKDERDALLNDQGAAYAALGYEDYEGEDSLVDLISLQMGDE